MHMKEHDPNKTLPRPGPTETQRLHPVAAPSETLPPVPPLDHDKTNPHLRVGTFKSNPAVSLEKPLGMEVSSEGW